MKTAFENKFATVILKTALEEQFINNGPSVLVGPFALLKVICRSHAMKLFSGTVNTWVHSTNQDDKVVIVPGRKV